MKNKRKAGPKPIPVKLDQELLDRIAKLSAKLGEAKSVVMRMAIRIGLEPMEKMEPASLPIVANPPAEPVHYRKSGNPELNEKGKTR